MALPRWLAFVLEWRLISEAITCLAGHCPTVIAVSLVAATVVYTAPITVTSTVRFSN